MGSCGLAGVKISFGLGMLLRESRPIPKTVRFRADPAQNGPFNGIAHIEHGLPIWILGFDILIFRRVKSFTIE
jgi:hypothetical protein